MRQATTCHYEAGADVEPRFVRAENLPETGRAHVVVGAVAFGDEVAQWLGGTAAVAGHGHEALIRCLR